MTLQELGIDGMSIPDRLELIGLIWDSIIDSGEPINLPESHRRELERRLAAADANPEAGVPWETVKERLLRKP
jgi:putative addiction module component (TIGR02574 family)